MPTLKEIEHGLRERLAELSRVRDHERALRERAKAKIEDEAISAGNNNSIGEVLDDLLIELGLHGRPRDVSVIMSIENRQTINPAQVRDIYVGGGQAYGAYQNITEALLFTTFDVAVAVSVPRDHDGCACDIPITEATIEANVGRLPAGVERVDTTIKWCGFNSYPYTTSADEESRCRNYRALRNQQKAEAHDSPTVQVCEFGHEYIEPHRHIFYRNGDITYSVRADYEPNAPSVTVPGWYGTGAQVGQPVPGTPPPPGEYNPDDPHRLLACEMPGHPLNGAHLHWRNPIDGHVTWSRNLDYESANATKVDGLFTRDATILGTVHTE